MIDDLKGRLVHLLMSFHRGRERAIKSRDLLRALYGDIAAQDESYNNLPSRELRQVIEDANHNDGGLICSSSSLGYWWAESLNDGLPAARNNITRALHQLENARKLESNLVKEFGGQIEMPLAIPGDGKPPV